MMGRCRVHCPDSGGGFVAAVVAVVAVVAVYVLWQLAVVLAVAAVAFLAVAAVGAWASRRLCWRLSVVYWRPARSAPPAARCWLCGATAARAALALDGAGGAWAWVCADGPGCAARAYEADRGALPAPRLMLEQARPVVYVITDARERISR